MQFKKIDITNKAGHKLSARLDLPEDDKPLAYALFAHCFTCSKNIKAVAHISRALTHNRIAVLRFDFTGLGESEGDFADTTFTSNIGDLVDAADFLKVNYDAPKILVGHSFGGTAVLHAASRIPSAAAVATIAAPADPNHVTQTLGNKKSIIERRGEAQVELAGRMFTIKKPFLDDHRSIDMRETLRSLNRALLVLHSPTDKVVGIENAAQIFQEARHPKSFISLDNADHLLMVAKDSLYAGSIIAAWSSRYISRPAPKKNR